MSIKQLSTVFKNVSLTATFVSLGVLVAVSFSTQPVHAFLWSDCRVQYLENSIGENNDNAFLGSVTALPNDRSFTLMQIQAGPQHTTADQTFVEFRLEDYATSFHRGAAGPELPLTYQYITCPSDIVRTYSDNWPIGNPDTSTTRTLPFTVDPDRVVVLASAQTRNAQYDSRDGEVIASLISPNEVELKRYASGTADTFAQYQVIEFSNLSGVTVQTAEVIMSDNVDSLAVNTDENGDPFAYDPAHTWLICQSISDTPGTTQSSVGCELTETEGVILHKHKQVAGKSTVRMYLVRFPEAAASVDRGSFTIDPNGTMGEPFTYAIQIPDTGLAGRIIPYITATSNDDVSQVYRNAWSMRMEDRSAIQIASSLTDATTDLDETTLYWQAVRFDTTLRPNGWGWIGNAVSGAVGGVGLINFQCANLSEYFGTPCGNGFDGSRIDYGVSLESGGCDANCDVSGLAWVGHYDQTDDVPRLLGYIDFDPDVSSGPPVEVGDDPATIGEDESLGAHWNEITGELYGWARFTTLAQYEEDQGGTANDWGWIKLRGLTDTAVANEYGVRYNFETNQFFGWAWSDDGTVPGGTETAVGTGLGWVKFDTDVVAAITQAYLRTSYGNVYAGAGIVLSELPPVGEYNATYLIRSSGDVVNFISEYDALDDQLNQQQQNPGGCPPEGCSQDCGPDGCPGDNNCGPDGCGDPCPPEGCVPDCGPDGCSGDNNCGPDGCPGDNNCGPDGCREGAPPVSGAFNFNTITNSQVLTIPSTVDETLIFSGSLGTLYVNRLIEKAIDRGVAQVGPCSNSLFQPLGAPLNRRVLYCDGDLTINQNLIFYNGAGTSSGAGTIIVNGDLYINDNMAYYNAALSSSIHNLASISWIVLGDVIIAPNVTQVVGAFTVLEYDSAGGTFHTGDSNLSLQVKGLVIAKAFDLQRGNVGSDTQAAAAEQFIYDGRVLANPPPGSEDMSTVLPRYDYYNY